MFLLIVVVLCVASLITAYWFIPRYAVGLIHTYEPYSFERVFENDTMKVNYGIYENRSPKDYGFKYEDVEYLSYPDSIRLSAWYVQGIRNLNSCIVLIHGRTSNRLKTMKYLELFRETGLDTLHNILIPDLRNSGKSQSASTAMGYEFAEDIVSSLRWLKENKKQRDFTLYTFSMGSMATAILFNRPDLANHLKAIDVSISKIIFDSPVSNVEKTLRLGSSRLGFPDLITDRTWKLFNEELNGFPKKMKLSYLLKSIPQPILILQGKNDHLTKHEFLIEEFELIDFPNVSLETFEGAGHVKIYQDSIHHSHYTQLVSDFIYSK